MGAFLDKLLDAELPDPLAKCLGFQQKPEETKPRKIVMVNVGGKGEAKSKREEMQGEVADVTAIRYEYDKHDEFAAAMPGYVDMYDTLVINWVEKREGEEMAKAKAIMKDMRALAKEKGKTVLN